MNSFWARGYRLFFLLVLRGYRRFFGGDTVAVKHGDTVRFVRKGKAGQFLNCPYK